MSWNPDLNRTAADDFENLSYPPNGGRVKLAILGIILPLAIAYFAGKAWITQEAVWPERGGWSMLVTGNTARSLAVCYFAAAAFCHFRWFWGLLPSYRVFICGTVLSMLVGLGGFGTALYFLCG